MSIGKTFLPAILLLGLLFPPGAVRAQNIQSYTDEKGTIHIGNNGPVSDLQGGNKEGTAADAGGASKAVASMEEPGRMPRRLRTRPSGREIEKRREAFWKVFPPRQPR